jgi:hypothetical protein
LQNWLPWQAMSLPLMSMLTLGCMLAQIWVFRGGGCGEEGGGRRVGGEGGHEEGVPRQAAF